MVESSKPSVSKDLVANDKDYMKIKYENQIVSTLQN